MVFDARNVGAIPVNGEKQDQDQEARVDAPAAPFDARTVGAVPVAQQQEAGLSNVGGLTMKDRFAQTAVALAGSIPFAGESLSKKIAEGYTGSTPSGLPDRTWGEAGMDVAAAAAKGGVSQLVGGTNELVDQALTPSSRQNQALPVGLSFAGAISSIARDKLGLPDPHDVVRDVVKSTTEYWDDKKSDSLKQREKLVAEADGFLGTMGASIQNPSTIFSVIAEQTLPMLIQIGGAGKVSQMVRDSVERNVAGPAMRQTAQEAGNKAAAATAVAFEGAQGGSMAGVEVRDHVMQMPIEDLRESPLFMEAARSYGENGARKVLADELANQATAMAGAATILISKYLGDGSRITDAIQGKALGGIRPVVGRVAAETLSEGVQESAEGMTADIAKTAVDPSVDPFDISARGKEAALGMLAGAGQAGGVEVARAGLSSVGGKPVQAPDPAQGSGDVPTMGDQMKALYDVEGDDSAVAPAQQEVAASREPSPYKSVPEIMQEHGVRARQVEQEGAKTTVQRIIEDQRQRRTDAARREQETAPYRQVLETLQRENGTGRDTNKVDQDRDDLLTVIAKLGGLSPEYLGGEVDIATMRQMQRVGRPIVRKPGEGLTPDHMAESLMQEGFNAPDGSPLDPNSLMEMIDDASRGKKIFSVTSARENMIDPDGEIARKWFRGDNKALYNAVQKHIDGKPLTPNQQSSLDDITNIIRGRDDSIYRQRDIESAAGMDPLRGERPSWYGRTDELDAGMAEYDELAAMFAARSVAQSAGRAEMTAEEAKEHAEAMRRFHLPEYYQAAIEAGVPEALESEIMLMDALERAVSAGIPGAEIQQIRSETTDSGAVAAILNMLIKSGIYDGQQGTESEDGAPDAEWRYEPDAQQWDEYQRVQGQSSDAGAVRRAAQGSEGTGGQEQGREAPAEPEPQASPPQVDGQAGPVGLNLDPPSAPANAGVSVSGDAEPESAGLRLEQQTEADRQQQEAAAKKAEEDRTKAEKDADNKRKADVEAQDFLLSGSDRPADVAAAGGQTGLFEAPVSDQGGDAVIFREAGVTINAEFEPGPASFNRNKFRAVSGDLATPYMDTKESAARELAERIATSNEFAQQADRLDRQMEILAEKLKRGESPAMDEWRGILGPSLTRNGYVLQPEISPFLRKYLGAPVRISEWLGSARGTLRSDSGATRPIVYVDRLAAVIARHQDAAAVDAAAEQVDTNPSPAQIEAGNYKKGHVPVQGLDITIENPRGSTRSGTDPDGNKWEQELAHHYGYIKRTQGADGEHVDVFIGPDVESTDAFVIDQVNADGTFDEHKIMLGFKNQKAARDGYRANYQDGWVVGKTTKVPVSDLKTWLETGDLTKPFSGEATATAPEHSAQHDDLAGIGPDEMRQMVKAFEEAGAIESAEGVTSIFDAPKKGEIVRLADKVKVHVGKHGWMTPAQAKKVIAEWKENTAKQYEENRSENNGKVVLSFFDYTGEWSKPWEEAGYEVWRFDIQHDADMGDVNNFSVGFFNDWFSDFDGKDVYAILAACPCTDFASSGARHFAAKDADGRTIKSIRLVRQTLAAIEYFKPAVWALENPVGRIEKLGGLPPWRLSFDPNHLGEDYTKKTLIWGRFNADLPIAPAEPTAGSKMHSQYGGSSMATKNARSATPEGFSYAFFQANNAVDHPAMALANKYDQLARPAIEGAINVGLTPAEITEIVDDYYYMDLDYEGANSALRAATEERLEQAEPGRKDPESPREEGSGKPSSKPSSRAGRHEETRQKARDLIGLKEGDQFTISEDFDYMTAGTVYEVMSIDGSGSVEVSNVERGSGTLLSLGMLMAAKRRGIAFQQQAGIEPADKNEKIEDLGEKIGGARKDTAISTGKRESSGVETDSRPAWAKRFEVVQIAKSIKAEEEGRWVINDTRKKGIGGSRQRAIRETFATKEEAESAIPLIAVSMKHRLVSTNEGGYEIWRTVSDRKRVKVVDRVFPSRDEAMKYMALNASEIIAVNTTFGEADIPLPPDRARSGKERRKGDVQGQDFMDSFGLRAVEFGNWNNQAERQNLLNDAYDGLMDLADVLNIPPRAIGLNGDLALAFGARGHGLASAKAHYEPDRAVINLTKERGAGSLAHEWFHALDHYLGRQDGKAIAEWKTGENGERTLDIRGPDRDFVSHGFRGERSGVRQEVREAYARLMRTISKKAEQYVEDTVRADTFVGAAKKDLEEALARLREDLAREHQYKKRNNKPASGEQLAEFDTIASELLAGNGLKTEARTIEGAKKHSFASIRVSNDSLDALSKIFKAVRGSSGFTADRGGVLDRIRGYMERYASRLKMLDEANNGEAKTRHIPTDFAMEAKELDQGRGSEYWTTPHEMAARAFQSYVEDKIAESGGVSRFLTYGPEGVGILTPWGVKMPFPSGAERKAINSALDDLVAAFRTRETDSGVALFSMSQGGDAIPDATRRIIADDPLLTAWTTLAMNDDAFQLPISKKASIKGIVEEQIPGATVEPADRDYVALSNATDGWLIKMPDGKGGDVHAYVFQKGNSVWINVADYMPGQGGRRIYNAVANYAFNRNKVFIGDPDGLSEIALTRRLENMISSGLKFGTTRHLWPHPDQEIGSDNVPGLNWRDGEDAHNLRQMIQASYAATISGAPEIAGFVYNPETDRFEDTANGNAEVTRKDFDSRAKEIRALRGHEDGGGEASPFTAGGRTLERAVLTHTILRRESEEGGAAGRFGRSLLDRLGRLGSQRLVGDNAILYSNTTEARPSAGLSASGLRGAIRKVLGAKLAESVKVVQSVTDLPPIPGVESLAGVDAAYKDAAIHYEEMRSAFLNVMEEDADGVDVMDAIDDFPAPLRRVLQALHRSDWLGFDYPSQALDAIFSEDAAAFEMTPGLKSALGTFVNAGTGLYSSASARIEGIYDPATGDVYLVADSIGNEDRAAWVAWHELFHRGIRSAPRDGAKPFGQDAEGLRQTLNRAGLNKHVKALADAIAKDRNMRPSDRLIAIEEALAELNAADETGDYGQIQRRYGVSVPASMLPGIRGHLARFFGAVRAILKRLGIAKGVVLDSDIIGIIKGARAGYGRSSNVQRQGVSEKKGRKYKAGSEGQGDLFAAVEAIEAAGEPIPEQVKKPVFEANFKGEMIETGSILLDVRQINTSRDAATFLRPYAAFAQEVFLVVPLDENNMPMGLLRMGKGTIDGAAVYPEVVTGDLLMMGAKSFWVAHNHPSGKTDPSEADRSITRKITDFTMPFGIPMAGHVILGHDGFSALTNEGATPMVSGTFVGDSDYDANGDKQAVRIYERVMTYVAPKEQRGKYIVNGPDIVTGLLKDIFKGAPASSGVVVLSNRHEVANVVMVEGASSFGLDHDRLQDFMRRVFSANAAAVIPFGSDPKAIYNLAKVINNVEIRVLDAMRYTGVGGGRWESLESSMPRWDDKRFLSVSEKSDSAMDLVAQSDAKKRQSTFLDGITSQPIDRLFRAAFDVSGQVDSHGRWKKGVAMDSKVRDIIVNWKPHAEGRFAWMTPILETARAGLLDRYGLSPEYKSRWREAEAEERRRLTQGLEILETLRKSNVGPAEAKVLQAMMTGEQIPEGEWGQLAEPIRRAIDDLGQELVNLGLLSAEAYQRNRGEYLHRSYLKHEQRFTPISRWVNELMTQRRRRITGDNLRARGIDAKVTMEQLQRGIPAEWWGTRREEGKSDKSLNGAQFILFEKLAPAGDGVDTMEGIEDGGPRKRRVLERNYWPADLPVPAKYEAWENRGKWEVRSAGGKNVVLWRDYTKAERTKMGEILDARYNIAKTFEQLSHDIALGKFFADIAKNPEWFQHHEPEGAEVIDAVTAGRTSLFTAVDWVKVPDAKIPKSGASKWGALSGGYVRAEIWRDLNELDKMQTTGMWRQLLTQWKLNKTARSPVVHMNNIMSNFMLMDMADVRLTDFVRGLRAYVDKSQEYQDAIVHGAFEGTFINEEIRQRILKPILDDIIKEQTGGGGIIETTGALGKFFDAIQRGIQTFDAKMTSTYQVEDEIFRMATYMRRLQLGDSPAEAAAIAREQFLDYDIRAPWVNAVRRTVMPFISYTYRAVPVVAQSMVHRPWKLAKYATLAYLAQAFAYALAPGDEDEEERTMRRDQQGMTWLGTPRMMRMPYRDGHGNPVFLDIRRWIPAGDVFDLNQGQSAIPVPAPLQFGGPLMLAAELALNKQAFTGREIVNRDTDTALDVAGKVADWAYKSWMPSAAYIPGSHYWSKTEMAITGARDIFGQQYRLDQALLSSVGIKLSGHDVDAGYYYNALGLAREQRQLMFEMRQLAKDSERGIISQARFERGKARVMEKMNRLGDRMKDLQGQ